VRALGLLGDDRLAALAAGGSTAAFETIYRRHQQALHAYCRSILRSDADAGDALQSTMLRALSALQDGREVAIRPWLFRIAHNEAVSLLRQRRSSAADIDEEPAAPASLESQVADRERVAELTADLRDLTERQRAALTLREVSGLSHGEIALVLGVSEGAAKQAIYEARCAVHEFDVGRGEDCATIRHVLSDGDRRALRGQRVRGHLRSCSGCRAFSAAVVERPPRLAGLLPPLPLGLAALVGRVAETASSSGIGGQLADSGPDKAAAGSLLAKAAVGAALAATATAGVVGVVQVTHPHSHRARTAAVAAHAPRPVHHRPAGERRAAPQVHHVAVVAVRALTFVPARPKVHHAVRAQNVSRSPAHHREAHSGEPAPAADPVHREPGHDHSGDGGGNALTIAAPSPDQTSGKGGGHGGDGSGGAVSMSDGSTGDHHDGSSAQGSPSGDGTTPGSGQTDTGSGSGSGDGAASIPQTGSPGGD
jgi:RNA polymerase sigma factor (sigma-70 family)